MYRLWCELSAAVRRIGSNRNRCGNLSVAGGEYVTETIEASLNEPSNLLDHVARCPLN